MIIKNKTGNLISLPFVTIPGYGQVSVDNSYYYHPMVQALISNNTVEVDVNNNLNVEQLNAIKAAVNPSSTNRFITLNELPKGHSNLNDPSTNQKEALDNSSNPSGINPYSTVNSVNSTVDSALSQHVIDYDHTPNPLTTDEIEAIQNSTAPSALNPMSTNSWTASTISTSIITHTNIPTAHHTNVNDPTSNQKAALTASNSPTVSNYYLVLSDMTAHTAVATAHHSNVNDLDSNQKAAITNATPSPTGVNPFITASNGNLLNSDQKGAISSANSPSSSNYFMTSNDLTSHTAVATAHHSNTNDPTTNQKAAMTASNSPSISNCFLTNNDLVAHTAVATAHHSNVNDPTTNQKAALTASNSPTTGNYYLVLSDMTAHTAIATAHHSNANDLSSDQKAAVTNATPSPTGANPFVTNSDSRLTDSRTPVAHASSHIGGSDAIQVATTSLNGLMSSTNINYIIDCLHKNNDIYLSRYSSTRLDCNINYLYISNTTVTSTLRTLLPSYNTIDLNGDDTGSSMASNTLYYLYVSNTDFKASTVAPSTINNRLMLTSSWIFVGYAYTNSSTEFSNDFSILSYYNYIPTSVTYSGSSIAATVNSTYEDLYSNSVLLYNNKKLQITVNFPISSTNSSNFKLAAKKDSSVTQLNESTSSSVISSISGSIIYDCNNAFSSYTIQHMYADVTGSASDLSKGSITLYR